MSEQSSTNVDASLEGSVGLERRLTVRVPSAEIEREIDQRLARLGKTTKLKGFRPGKVPKKVVRQRFGSQVRQEVLSDMIRASFSYAVDQQNLNPAGGPSIEPLSVSENEDLRYRATFEVYPDIEIAGLESLAVELPKVEIGDADVDDMIEKLRLQRSEWHAVERRAAEGDRVVVDFEGKIDKEPFEGGQGSEMPIELGAGEVLPELERALVGAAAGDDESVKVKFPKTYPSPELAGKKAVFDVHVHRVEERVMPELDAEFIAAFGIEEGGLDALKADVRRNMQRELDERLRAERKSRVLDAFLAANPITVPNALVEQEIREMQAEAMRRMGVDDPEQAPPRDAFVEHARRRVALGLLVQELIIAQGIELDRERVDARIEELVAPYEQPEEAARLYRGSRELMQQVESTVLEEQVVDFLVEKGQASEKSTSFTEFMGA